MRQLTLDLRGAVHPGPLFAPPVKRRPPKVRPSGGKEVWAKYSRALPPWTTHAQCRVFWAESRRLTAATGVQHSVDHIVPLQHALVCGLHCPNNLRVIPLKANQIKSNATWPDMPVEQASLGL